jgi:hypothetical protein
MEAQECLCRRYRKLAQAGKLPTVITAAIARELAGFIWAIARQAQSTIPEWLRIGNLMKSCKLVIRIANKGLAPTRIAVIASGHDRRA